MTDVKERAVRAVTWDALGRGLLFFLNFAGSLIVVRMLGSVTYGQLAIILSLYSLVAFGMSFGFKNAVLRFTPQLLGQHNHAGIWWLLNIVCRIRVMAWMVASLVVVIGAQPLSESVLGRPEVAPYLRLLPIFLLIPIVYDIVAALAVATFQQRLLNLTEVSTKALYLILLTAFLWASWGIIGVLTAAFVTQFVAVGILGMVLARAFDRGRQAEHTPTLTTRRLFEFSASSYVASLLAFVLGKDLDVLLLGRFVADVYQVSAYVVAFTFVTLSYQFLLVGVSGGFELPLVAELHTTGDRGGLRRVYGCYFEYVYVFVIPLAVGGMMVGEDLVVWFYGESFRGLSQLLTPLFLFTCLAKLDGLAAMFLTGMDRERQLVVIRMACGLVNLALNLVLIPKYGALGAVWGTGSTMVLMAACTSAMLHRLMQPQYPLRFLIRTSVAAAVMGVILLTLKRFFLSAGSPLETLLLLVVGLGVYGSMIIWLKPVSVENVKALARAPIPGVHWLATLLHP